MDLSEDHPIEIYLARIRALAEVAVAGDHITRVAPLGELQRLTGWALRAAVSDARASGMSWRALAKVVGVPATTLHLQFKTGRGLSAASTVSPTTNADDDTA